MTRSNLLSSTLYQKKASLTVFELTVDTSPRDFVKTILHKIDSNLIGVATKLLSKFFV